ncbi:MAG: COG1361 S-layer family protein [Candidatus Aenigmarchaeota archaeon]|nr:COG1361 S-layer family protein [Candidatus Aenigmarchaeota archaeon]
MKKIIFLITMVLLLSVSFTAGISHGISINLINQDPDPAIAGNIVEVRLGVTNLDREPTENIVMKLEPGYPFELLRGENQISHVGVLSAYQGTVGDYQQVMKYKLKVDSNAPAGSYDLKVSTFESNSPIITTRIVSIDIQNKESAEIIYIDKVALIPGKITPLKFTVTNVGSSPLNDITFSWDNSDDIILPVGSDNTKYIKNLDPGNFTDLVFNVIASTTASPNLYKLDLKLTYDDSITGKQKEITSKAGVYIGGETDFDIAFSGTSNSQTSLSVSNIGSIPAGSVTVAIPTQQHWSVSGGDSVIIGNLNDGDYTIVSFTLTQTTTEKTMFTQSNLVNKKLKNMNNSFIKRARPKNTSLNPNELSVEISYTDSRGLRHSITKQVAVEPAKPSFTSSNFSTKRKVPTSLWGKYKWIIFGIIVLICGYIYYKKKRKVNR